MDLRWYWKRLGRMSFAELVWRARSEVLKTSWSAIRVRQGQSDPLQLKVIDTKGPEPLGRIGDIDTSSRDALLAAADDLLRGRWKVFAIERRDFLQPDWFLDSSTGIRAPNDIFAFRYPNRDTSRVGDLKYVWDASRHHHLTVLSAAYFLTRDTRYAERVAQDLRSWWAQNPFLTGPNWISGIELGIRLISWVWCRRLLAAWPAASDLFERNPVFQNQLYRHQQYLDALFSRYSSANNHVVAETAGQYVAACAFPLFAESQNWRERAGRLLEHELKVQTFPSGLNRELATEYHPFVMELALAAALEGEASGYPLSADTWALLRDMSDALATIVDAHGRPPRQGDADDGTALLLDAPRRDEAISALSLAATLLGQENWWPSQLIVRDVRRALLEGLISPPARCLAPRNDRRTAISEDAGMVLFRGGRDGDEIWCRLDHGPQGYLATAAHGHADALSIELRVGGVDVLADPGTYCYHMFPAWRRHFRSTFGHNTLALFGRDQSESAGPFLWSTRARSRLLALKGLTDVGVAHWCAEHDGYAPTTHRRSVTFDRGDQSLTIRDEILGNSAPASLSFHLGPSVSCRLDEDIAYLSWSDGRGVERAASLELPRSLCWRSYHGSESPIAGWYSPNFGSKRPAIQLVGRGTLHEGEQLVSTFKLMDRVPIATTRSG